MIFKNAEIKSVNLPPPRIVPPNNTAILIPFEVWSQFEQPINDSFWKFNVPPYRSDSEVHAYYNIIRNCYVDANNTGIYVYNVADETATIVNNTCTNGSHGDELTDSQEVNDYGTNPLTADTDSDGLTDGQEVQVGTDPNDPNSYPTNEQTTPSEITTPLEMTIRLPGFRLLMVFGFMIFLSLFKPSLFDTITGRRNKK